jgi:hypothetical protein
MGIDQPAQYGDRPTNGRTNGVSYRGACLRLKMAALTLTGTKEKTLYFSSSDLILALFLSFFPFFLSLVMCRSSSVVSRSNAPLL